MQSHLMHTYYRRSAAISPLSLHHRWWWLLWLWWWCRQCSVAVEIEFVAIIDQAEEAQSGILYFAAVFAFAPPEVADVVLYLVAAPCTLCLAQYTVEIGAVATFAWRID